MVSTTLPSQQPKNKQPIHTRRIRVLKATIEIVSNNPSLMYDKEYFEGYFMHSQWANLPVLDAELDSEVDGHFYILDYEGFPTTISIEPEKVTAIGDFSMLERTTHDKRYSLFGNQGLLFRFILTVLERSYGIYNFHACGLYQKDRDIAYLVLGERGSGKSAVLLAALDTGRFRTFATEIVSVNVTKKGVVFHKGSLRNNVRLGHLKYDFPNLAKKIGLKTADVQDPWGTKIQIDLGKFGIRGESIVDPELVIVVPRIEEELGKAQVKVSTDLRKIKRNLFENITDKIASLGLLYETIPIGSLDNPSLLRDRKAFVDRFVSEGRISRVVSLFASPRNCLEGWM